MEGEQATVGCSEDALSRGVLDHRGKILVLALDAVAGAERATHPRPLRSGRYTVNASASARPSFIMCCDAFTPSAIRSRSVPGLTADSRSSCRQRTRPTPL
jgi:hypothetical protein